MYIDTGLAEIALIFKSKMEFVEHLKQTANNLAAQGLKMLYKPKPRAVHYVAFLAEQLKGSNIEFVANDTFLQKLKNCTACIVETTTLALLHTNSTYPAHENELNLNVISAMRKRYGCVVGYSGHEFGLVATIIAVALGAKIIERHVTLSRTLWGTDQMASVEPQGMMKLISQIRTVEIAVGDGKKIVYDSELPIRKKLRGY